MHLSSQKYLGFSWLENNIANYHTFTSLPFGLSTDKIPLSRFQTKPYHSKLLCNSTENPPTTNLSTFFQICNYTIPQNQQTQDHRNLDKGILSVPDLKMNNILTYLHLVVDNINQLTARKFAAVACKIIALSLLNFL
jgi:hypothetical protein